MSALIHEEVLYEKITAILDGPDKNRVAGWGLERDGTDITAWVSLAGDKRPSRLARRVVNVNLDVVVTVGANHTFEELVAELEQMDQRAVLGHGALYAQVDVEANRIVAFVAESEEPVAANAKADVSVPAQIETASGIEIEIRYLPTEAGTDSNVDTSDGDLGVSLQSPTQLVQGGRTFGGCMTGAVAQHNGSVGVITAAHCRAGGASISALGTTWSIARSGDLLHSGSSDLAFYSAANSERLIFKDDFWNGRKVKDVRRVLPRRKLVGRLACVTGRDHEAQRCGEITSITTLPAGDGTANSSCFTSTCRPVWVGISTIVGGAVPAANAEFYTCRGDSGGPLYKGTSLYGFVSGAAYANSASSCSGTESDRKDNHVASWFTAAEYVKNRLGATISTTDP